MKQEVSLLTVITVMFGLILLFAFVLFSKIYSFLRSISQNASHETTVDIVYGWSEHVKPPVKLLVLLTFIKRGGSSSDRHCRNVDIRVNAIIFSHGGFDKSAHLWRRKAAVNWLLLCFGLLFFCWLSCAQYLYSVVLQVV